MWNRHPRSGMRTQAAARDDRTNADLAASLAPGRGDDLAHPLARLPTRAARSLPNLELAMMPPAQ